MFLYALVIFTTIQATVVSPVELIKIVSVPSYVGRIVIEKAFIILQSMRATKHFRNNIL